MSVQISAEDILCIKHPLAKGWIFALCSWTHFLESSSITYPKCKTVKNNWNASNMRSRLQLCLWNNLTASNNVRAFWESSSRMGIKVIVLNSDFCNCSVCRVALSLTLGHTNIFHQPVFLLMVFKKRKKHLAPIFTCLLNVKPQLPLHILFLCSLLQKYWDNKADCVFQFEPMDRNFCFYWLKLTPGCIGQPLIADHSIFR